jgi:WXG100 family type VII secretion target
MPENLPNGEYKVDLDKLDAVTDEVRSLEAFIAEHKDEVKTAAALLSQGWQGTASAEALAKFGRWDEDAQKLHEGVQAMRKAARDAHGNYTGALNANMSMLKGE